jgi:hypothetical protein
MTYNEKLFWQQVGIGHWELGIGNWELGIENWELKKFLLVSFLSPVQLPITHYPLPIPHSQSF